MAEREMAERLPQPLAERRLAKIPIWPGAIAEMMDLPEGYGVHHIYAANDPQGIVIVVSSEDLERVHDGVELPYMTGHWDRAVLVGGPEDLPYFRWGWSPEASEVDLDRATTKALLEELSWRMAATQNSNAGRDLGRTCVDAVNQLDNGVLDYRTKR